MDGSVEDVTRAAISSSLFISSYHWSAGFRCRLFLAEVEATDDVTVVSGLVAFATVLVFLVPTFITVLGGPFESPS